MKTINYVWHQVKWVCVDSDIPRQKRPMGDDEHTFISPLPLDSFFGDGSWGNVQKCSLHTQIHCLHGFHLTHTRPISVTSTGCQAGSQFTGEGPYRQWKYPAQSVTRQGGGDE